jgi:hypothetical protein
MTHENVLQMATLLMAIKNDFSIVDRDPDLDYLIFSSEDDELEFYPKKSLPEQMEALGLIEGSKQVLDPYTHYEGDPQTGGWTAITSPPATVYYYQVTAKGDQFLNNAPNTLGHPLPPLKMASDTSVIEHSHVKPIEVVTHTPEDLQKLHDDFVRMSKDKIESLFVKNAAGDSATVPDGLACGRKLWTKLEPEAIKNGVNPQVRRVVSSTWSDSAPSTTFESAQPGSGIRSAEQVRLFMKTLLHVFAFEGKLSVRQLTESEAAQNRDFVDIAFGSIPSFTPMLTQVSFFVEYGTTRFLVKVKNKPGYDFLKISPEISSIEFVERP